MRVAVLDNDSTPSDQLEITRWQESIPECIKNRLKRVRTSDRADKLAQLRQTPLIQVRPSFHVPSRLVHSDDFSHVLWFVYLQNRETRGISFVVKTRAASDPFRTEKHREAQRRLSVVGKKTYRQTQEQVNKERRR